MYVSSSETGSFSKRESDQSLIVLANENFGLSVTPELEKPLLGTPPCFAIVARKTRLFMDADKATGALHLEDEPLGQGLRRLRHAREDQRAVNEPCVRLVKSTPQFPGHDFGSLSAEPAASHLAALNAEGVCRNLRLNQRLKCAASAKPHSKAISVTDRLPLSSSHRP